MPPVPPINRRNFCTPILEARKLTTDDAGLARCSAALAECLARPVDATLTEFQPSRHLDDPTGCVKNVLDDREPPNFSVLSTRLTALELALHRIATVIPSENEAQMLGVLLEKRILPGITDRFLQGYDDAATEELWKLRQRLVSLKARWKHAEIKALDTAIDKVQQKFIAIEQQRGNHIVWTNDFYHERSTEPQAEAGNTLEPTASLVRLLDCEAKELDPSYIAMRYQGKPAALVTCWQQQTVHELDAANKLALLGEIFTQGNYGPIFLSTPQMQIMAWRLRAFALGDLLSEKKIAQQITNPERADELREVLQKILAQSWTEMDPGAQRDDTGYDPAVLRNQLNASITLLRNHAEALRAKAAGPSPWRVLIPDGIRAQFQVGGSSAARRLKVAEAYAGFSARYIIEPELSLGVQAFWQLHPDWILSLGGTIDWQNFVAAPSREPFVRDFQTVSGGPDLAVAWRFWDLPDDFHLSLGAGVNASFGTLFTPHAMNVGHESLLYRAQTKKPFYNLKILGQLLVDIPLPGDFALEAGLAAGTQYLHYEDGSVELRNSWEAFIGGSLGASYRF